MAVEVVYLHMGLLREVENSACEVVGTRAARAVQVCVPPGASCPAVPPAWRAPDVGLVHPHLQASTWLGPTLDIFHLFLIPELMDADC